MKIGIICTNFFKEFGGAERSCVLLANALADRGHQITIFYHGETDNKATLFMHSALSKKVKCLNLAPGSSTHYGESQILSSSGVELVIGFVLAIGSEIFSRLLSSITIPVILSARSSRRISGYTPEQRLSSLVGMSLADTIHVQHASFVAEYPAFLRERIVVIPNYVRMPPSYGDGSTSDRKKNILGVGRFVERQKSFSILLEAFALLASKYPEWRLTLCGKGEDEEKTKKISKILGIEDKVIFPGMLTDVTPYYAASSIFCIPSKYEGFPNVLAEAQSHALPCVGFADCPGVDSMIEDKIDGLLVKNRNAKSLANALEKLINNADLRLEFGQQAHAKSKKYAAEIITNRWEKCIKRTMEQKEKRLKERMETERLYFELMWYNNFGTCSINNV